MKKARDDMSFETAAGLFRYDPDTGVLYRRNGANKGRWPDRPVTRINTDGYVLTNVNVDGVRRDYRAHRVAWLLTFGSWPEQEIDHINGVRSDNRIINLRVATPRQNLANRKGNRCGLKGAYPCNKRWRSAIGRGAAFVHLGMYDTEVEAHNAWLLAAKIRYGDFAHA